MAGSPACDLRWLRVAFQPRTTVTGGADVADHPNAELFRRGYAAFQQGDLDTVRSLFAPDIIWHVPGNNHLSGDYRGVDDVIAQFVRNFEETGGTFKVELHDILANDEHAVALASTSGTKDGRTLDDNYVHVVHIAGGKLTESWIFDEHQDLVDAFWG
jgi:ketosteroid isomerase-like protein